VNVTAFEKKENNTAELTVEIEAEIFNGAVESVYKRTRGKISVPGFRPGKAPRKIIENLYGASVFQDDALDEVLPEALSFGIKEKELRTVGYPKLGDVSVGDDKTVSAIFTVTLYPEIEIGEYKGIRASKPSTDVPESAVDSEIEALRLRNASLETTDRPAINGDTVIIDYAGSIDGVPFDGGTAENHELELGSGSFIPGFEEKLQGMTTGETRDIEVVFPEEYHAEQLAGKPAVFNVTLREVRTKILPEADDEFAKDVSEFDTITEYRADVRKKLEEAREKDAADWFENALLDALAETVTGEIPEEMIEEQIDSGLRNMQTQLSQYGIDPDAYFKMSGLTTEDYRRDSRPQAEKQVKVSLALEKIVEKEDITATDEQVEAMYAEMAERYSTDVDTVKGSVEEDAARHETKMRAAIKLVVENGIAEPVAAKSDTSDTPAESGEPKPKRVRRAATKAKAEAEAPQESAQEGAKESAKESAEEAAPEKPKRQTKAAVGAKAKDGEKTESAPGKKPAKKAAKPEAPEDGESAPEKPKRTRAKKPPAEESGE
jgi:trigger factor